MARILIAEDEDSLRSLIARALMQDGHDVMAKCDGGEALDCLTRENGRFDLLLTDIRMPVMDGIEATRRIAADPTLAGVHVVILTNYGLDEYVFNALRAGAAGFLVKDIQPEDFLHAVRVAARGDALLAPSVTRRMIEQFARRTLRPDLGVQLESLTQREREVLAHLMKGRTVREIAAAGVVSEATVRTQVRAILTKLEVSSQIAAVGLAYTADWRPLPQRDAGVGLQAVR